MISQFDPKQHVTLFRGVPIHGFADGTFIAVARRSDMWSLQVGADGEAVYVKSNDRSATVTITLQMGSSANDFLSAIARLDELVGGGAGPLLLKDLTGRSVFAERFARIQKISDVEYGKEATTRAWIILCPALEMKVAGNNPPTALPLAV